MTADVVNIPSLSCQSLRRWFKRKTLIKKLQETIIR